MNPSRPSSLSVLVKHSDPLLCAGLVAALREHPVFEVFVHGQDDLNWCQRRVDVAITDYEGGMRLVDAAGRQACGQLGHPKVLVLTTNCREADIRRAIQAGVLGYLLLGTPVHELVEGVLTVGSSVRYLGRAVAQRMAESLTREALTAREIDVLRLVVTGQGNKVIARQLAVELGTIKSHVSAIMAKLGAASRTEATRIALARGIVEEDNPMGASLAWDGRIVSKDHDLISGSPTRRPFARGPFPRLESEGLAASPA